MEPWVKIIIYILAIVASLIAVIASFYKIYEAKIKIKAHEKEKGKVAGTESPLSSKPTNAKLEKKKAKQLTKLLKKQKKS